MNDSKPVVDHDADEEMRDDAVIGQALKGSLIVLVVIGVVVAGIIYVVRRPDKEPAGDTTVLELPEVRAKQQALVPHVPFVDITRQAGIDFRHENGAYGDKLLPETMGAGCAMFDYDGDGDIDVLLINGNRWPWDKRPTSGPPPTMKLYRNDGSGQLQDVTQLAGLNVPIYGMGCAVGDYDNDGDRDLFITSVNRNHLFRNDGGKFTDVTAAAGVGGRADRWSTSACWLDFDNDSDLDLFVCNYVRWNKEIDLGQSFRLVGVGRAYGPPTAFEGSFPYLYRNNGDGTFSDISAEAGVEIKNPNTGVPVAKSLGVAPADLDGDGWIDLVVANDTVGNFVFRNVEGKRFEEIGILSGIAFDMSGQARGAMGIDAARFRNSPMFGVAIGNFSNEMTSLYVGVKDPLVFADVAVATGLGPQTLSLLTFGLYFFDYDLDGRLDLLAANGHLEEEINKVQISQHYEQPPQLFWNAGLGQSSEFVRVHAEKCGDDLVAPMVGRGASYGDIDGDGDLDVLLTASGRAPRLLRNDQALEHHWVRFELVGKNCNRDAIGAWIHVHADDRKISRQVMPSRSYLSQVELPVTVGVASSEIIERVEIVWPDGSSHEMVDLGVNRAYRIEQGASQ